MVKNILAANENVIPGQKELQLLKENFPACFAADGSFDFSRFKEYLNTQIAVKNEGYELRFLGKNYARLIASEDTTTVIVPDEEHNSKPENCNSKNIYISGDNLDGLKHLLKSYAGKVKCIYIDPPYNTGSDDFVYKDNFNFTASELSSRLSIDEEQAQRILDLTKRGSASHSAWLMFMYPRLLLARDLLSDDGVIFISIDDNEQANLKLLCDDIFGEENHVMTFCRKGYGGKQDSSYFAKQHEYILCFSKPNFIAGEILKDGETYRFYDDQKKRKYNRILLRKWGDEANRNDRPNMYYPLYFDGVNISLTPIPDARPVYPKLSDGTDGRWRLGKDTMELAIEKQLIEIVPNECVFTAYERIYEPLEGEIETKLYSSWIDMIDNSSGKALLKSLFGGVSPFDYPKPLDLIKRILSMGNVQDALVVDFFSGSATTAHAVMELNQEDGDHRKYIQIQLPELCKPGSEAENLGFHTIDKIGMKRIELAAQKIREENPLFHGDLGFKHYTLKEPGKQTLDKLEEFDPQCDWLTNTPLLEEFGRATVLETWRVRDGYGFSAPVQEIDFAGYKAYHIDKHLYLLDSGLTEEVTTALIYKLETDGKFNPENIVIFGYSFILFQLDALKNNLKRVEQTKNLRVNVDIRY